MFDPRSISLVVLVAFTLGLSACCCPSSGPSTACEAKLKYSRSNASAQKPFRSYGSGKTEAAAIDNACWAYCAVADKKFDGVYHSHADSKKHKDKLSWSTSPTRDRKLRAAHEACISRCNKASRKGADGFSAAKTACDIPSGELEAHAKKWNNYK